MEWDSGKMHNKKRNEPSLALKRQILQGAFSLACGTLPDNKGLSVTWGLECMGMGGGCPAWESSACPVSARSHKRLSHPPSWRVMLNHLKFAPVLVLCHVPMWTHLQRSVQSWIPCGRCRSLLQSVGTSRLPSAVGTGSREHAP